ncbi:MAG: phosphotransferase [Acholeplasmataceae bacterium]|nr:phosphotransferase [Acholeplasmataceae bacterium]
MKLPDKIEILVKYLNITEYVEYHASGDRVFNLENKYILKISKNCEKLLTEFENDQWISNLISSPKPVEFSIEDNKAYYLREYLEGEVLCLPKYLENPSLVIEILVEAINYLHNIKVEKDNELDVLTHGDFCLPNILVKDNKFHGFIDLGDASINDPWVDYAWCIWSFQYNLKTDKYTQELLDRLNIKFDLEKYNKYIRFD